MVQPATLWLRGVRLRPQSHKDTTRTFVIHLDHRSRTWTCLRRLEAKFRMSNTKSKHLWSEELEGMESFSSVFLDVFSVFWPLLSFVEATATAEDQTSLVTRTAGLHSALNPGKRWLCGFAWRRFSLSTLPINGHAEWRGWKRGGGTDKKDKKKKGEKCIKSAAGGRTGLRKREKCREKEWKGGKSNRERFKKDKNRKGRNAKGNEREDESERVSERASEWVRGKSDPLANPNTGNATVPKK